ncbi:uncharacterized protein [Dendrobates tinctorius]|uniref:uncharacterized protein n=1 Tax=Dendrobates tinctorius TaxID=92724 RepID=UPI003CC94986
MDGWDNASPRVRKDFLNKVRTRWRSMKDRFNRDIRQENQVRSGAAARTGTKYRYHRALAFLRPVLASRTTWSSTLQPGPEAVLHQAAPDPSQPSISEEAPCRSAPQSSGDQEAGRSGVPLSQVSATGFAGTSGQQRQRTLDRPLMPEFVELSSVFQSSLKALSDRLESGFLLLDQRYKSIEGRLERLEVDLARPAHHFYTQIARDTAEHLTPDLQLTVMQACNNAFMQAMQQSRIMQQSVVAFPPVPPLTRFTALPTSAAYHCTATTLPSLAGHQYTAPSPSAAGHLPANTMPSAAPAWPTTAAATTTGWPVVTTPACSAATTTTSGRTTPVWTATATTPAWTATTTSTTTSEQHQLGDPHSIFTAPARTSTTTSMPQQVQDPGRRSTSARRSPSSSQSTASRRSRGSRRSPGSSQSSGSSEDSSKTTGHRHKKTKRRTLTLPPPSPPTSQLSLPRLPSPTSLVPPSPRTPYSTQSRSSSLHTPQFPATKK